MANGKNPLGVVIALVVGLGGGWFVNRLIPAPFSAEPGNHLIKVGPTAKDVGTSMGKIHQTFWKARGHRKTLEVRFKSVDFPQGANKEPPFENGVNNEDQVFTCAPGTLCKSGKVNPKVKDLVPPEGFYYKYWQTLIDDQGNKDTADAGIIIEK